MLWHEFNSQVLFVACPQAGEHMYSLPGQAWYRAGRGTSRKEAEDTDRLWRTWVY